jgi:L-lysine epsilon oxidase-like protein
MDNSQSVTGGPAQDNVIVRAAIHPSIGIARLGNSDSAYFFAPEVVDPPAAPRGFYRDSLGALKRQAVRFRVYGFNAAGQAVAELTQQNSDISWTVHLANKKAAWYQFQMALDITEAGSAPHSFLRNVEIADRNRLVIDPGPTTITGVNQSGPRYAFDRGKFMEIPVYLGELRTDEDGRLIVLGGHGKSASYNGTRAVTFANNEGWYDDVSDGPVTAVVQYQGMPLQVDPAWVVVAPPNYAPNQKSVRTMWDLMRDTAIMDKRLKLAAPASPSFTADILPIFERLSRLQWVNAGFAAAFGWGGPNNFTGKAWLKALASNSADQQELRQSIANQFRNFDRDAWSPIPWPWNYGDAMNVPAAHTPRQNTALTGTQLTMLQQWADGHFDSDYVPDREPYRALGEVPLSEQPQMLDRASLDFCLADAFHPGCEMTWPMRTPSLYMAPFRIKHAAPGRVEPQYGAVMNKSVLPNGVLGGQFPGGLTRWMAIPWQTDTASCRCGYESYDPYLPTFWPARAPNQVLTDRDYKIVMDLSRPMEQRLAAFAKRVAWTRPLGSGGYVEQVNKMVTDFGDMGVIEDVEGPGDDEFPRVIGVEDLNSATSLRLADVDPYASDKAIDWSEIEKTRRFPNGLK